MKSIPYAIWKEKNEGTFKVCERCYGTGIEACPECSGKGKVEVEGGEEGVQLVTCDYCLGERTITCTFCFGYGDNSMALYKLRVQREQEWLRRVKGEGS